MKIFVVSIAMLLVCTDKTLAENSRMCDSLRNVVAKTEGKAKLDALMSLALELTDVDYNEALLKAIDTYSLACNLGDTTKMVHAGRLCGQLFNVFDRSNDAISILTPLLKTALRNNLIHDYKLILTNLGLARTFKGEYDKALPLHYQVLELSERDNDEYNICVALVNIGLNYFWMKSFREALTYYEKALSLQLKIKDYHNIEKLYTNIGLCHNGLGEYSRAIDYFNKSASYCDNQKSCDALNRIQVNHARGVAYYGLQKYDSAKGFFSRSLETIDGGENERFTAENLYWLSRIDIVDGNFYGAIKSLKKAELLSERNDYKEILMNIYYDLSVAYESLGEVSSSSFYLKKYVAMKDSIYSEEVMGNLAQYKSDFAQRENLAIIKARELTIAQQRKLNYAIIIISIMAVTLVGVLYYKNYVVNKINAELSRAKDMIYVQNKQLHLRNVELDALVEKKTEELRFVNFSLQEVNDELNNFIYRTAQEIRSPLSTLKGICHVALMDLKDNMAQEYFQKVNLTTEILQSTMRRLLVINKTNHFNNIPSQVDLRSLVDNVIDKLRTKGWPHNLILRKNISEKAMVNCDQELLTIVLENSIDHAITFCNNSPRTDHFIEINTVTDKLGRVNIRIVHNGVITSEYSSDNIYEFFLDPSFTDNQNNINHDLFFLRTAAKKIGGTVELKKTPEGYNELNVII